MLVYINNILIYLDEDKMKYINIFQRFIKLLREYNLKLKRKKYKFFRDVINFVSFKIDR